MNDENNIIHIDEVKLQKLPHTNLEMRVIAISDGSFLSFNFIEITNSLKKIPIFKTLITIFMLDISTVI